MKEIEMFQLEKNEEKLIELLQRFNYLHADAKILTYMLKKKKAISKRIEQDMDLRQPEVSTAVKRLRTQGIIGKTEIHHGKGKGRPTHEYHLKTNSDAVRAYIIKHADEQIAEKVSWLEEMKSILDEVTKS